MLWYNLFMTNYSLRVLYVYNGIFVLAGGFLGPLYTVFVQNFEKNIFTISLSWATFLISTTVFMFIISKTGDRILEKEYLLMGGYLLRAAGWFLFAFIDSLSMLIFLQILLGLGEALGSPAFDTIFAEHLDSGRHVAEYANWKLIENITVAIAVIIGGFIVSRFGFMPLFYLMSVLAMISFIGVLLKPRSLL